MPVACTLVEGRSDLPDPRAERARRHNLLDILVLALGAVICGAEGWDDIVLFAHAFPYRFEGGSHSYAESVEKGHGCIATRRCWQIDLDSLHGLWNNVQRGWSGLSSILRVERLFST